ncbi:MAG: hypothetical protein KGL59_12720 [Acidobacteriota bacterium]|nr:hypothetical protein [Acidobacteriota bacterium]
MSRPLVRYQGFATKNAGREYTFQVNDSNEESREFTLTIANDAFTSRRVRFQDAPEICSLKLERELAAEQADPSKTRAKPQFSITEAELDEYREARSPKLRHTYRKHRPRQAP